MVHVFKPFITIVLFLNEWCDCHPDFCHKKRWLLNDFGFSTLFDGECNAVSHEGRGTPGHRAPELLEGTPGKISTKSDIWALGCLLFSLCTTNGRRAFQSDAAVLRYCIRWDASSVPQVRYIDNIQINDNL